MPFLEIAGLYFDLDARTDAARALMERYSAYECAPTSRPDVRLTLGADRPSSSSEVALVRNDAWLAVAEDPEVMEIGGVARSNDLERLWMHALASLLASRGGLVVHGAAVEGRNGAFAFLGPSGAGKTTAARNCPARLLSPDRIAIGLADGAPWLAPLPFLYGEPRDGGVFRRPLGRLLFVEKGESNALHELHRAAAVGRILGGVLMPSDPGLAEQALRLADDLSRLVPLEVLEARIDGGFWPLLAGRETVAPEGEK